MRCRLGAGAEKWRRRQTTSPGISATPGVRGAILRRFVDGARFLAGQDARLRPAIGRGGGFTRQKKTLVLMRK